MLNAQLENLPFRYSLVAAGPLERGGSSRPRTARPRTPRKRLQMRVSCTPECAFVTTVVHPPSQVMKRCLVGSGDMTGNMSQRAVLALPSTGCAELSENHRFVRSR